MEIVCGTVELVGAAFQADVDDGSGFPSILRSLVLLVVKFLDRVKRQVAGRCSLNSGVVQNGLTVVRVVVVGAIDNVVIVVGPVAIRGRGVKAASGNALHSRPELQQVLEIPPLQRQLVNSFVRDGAPERVGCRFYQRLLAGHFHHFGNLTGMKRQVDADVSRDFEANSLALDRLEGRRGHGNRVESGRQIRSEVLSGRIRQQSALHAGFSVLDADGRVDHYGARLVGDSA